MNQNTRRNDFIIVLELQSVTPQNPTHTEASNWL